MSLQRYFQSYGHYFWQWENRDHTGTGFFEACSMVDGPTIAYEPYIMEVVELLAPSGLPPFGSLLLAIAATQEEPDTAINFISHFLLDLDPALAPESTPGEVIAAMELLRGVNSHYLKGPGRIQLFRAIFSTPEQTMLGAKAARKLVSTYAQERHLMEAAGVPIPLTAFVVHQDFDAFSAIGRRFSSAEDIIAAVAALPEVEAPQTLLKESAVEEGWALDDLMADEKTYHIGALLPRLWSGMHFPMRHTASGAQPLGGISDLTNKGDFDRLLISEFANEDEVFLSRLANREALYIKRELPPEKDERRRLLLVDVTLTGWGIGRHTALAAALAVATHPRNEFECHLYVVDGEFREMPIKTKSDIIRLTEQLSVSMDAQPGFDAFFKSGIARQGEEVFVFSYKDAIRREGMQHLLSQFRGKYRYLAVADNRGGIEFFQSGAGGRRRLDALTLPLDELWSDPPKKQTKPRKSKRRAAEPAKYPMLLPIPNAIHGDFVFGQARYFLTKSKQLWFSAPMRQSGSTLQSWSGAQVLYTNISIKGQGVFGLEMGDSTLYLYFYYPNENYIGVLDLEVEHFRKLPVVPGPYSLHTDETGVYAVHPVAGTICRLSFYLETDGQPLAFVADTGVEERQRKHPATPHSYGQAHSAFQNLRQISIDSEGMLVFNRVALTIRKWSTEEVLFFEKRTTGKFLSRWKDGAYHFADGSHIIFDRTGMFTMVSADPALPRIYMPTATSILLALATDEYFAGNPHFKKESLDQKVISVSEFRERFLTPFINHIMQWRS